VVYDTLDPLRRLECVPCSVGAFCANGTQTQCMDGLSTAARGASSPLDCIPITSVMEQQFQIDILFVVKGASSPSAVQCPTLHQLIINWLEYGALYHCFMGSANYSHNVGGVQCIVSAGLPYSALYMSWLTKALSAQQIWMQTFLRGCLQSPALFITDTSVYPLANSNSNSSVAVKSNDNSSSFSQDALLPSPQLDYVNLGWGHSQADITTFFASALILSVSMALSICMLAVGLLLQHYYYN